MAATAVAVLGACGGGSSKPSASSPVSEVTTAPTSQASTAKAACTSYDAGVDASNAAPGRQGVGVNQLREAGTTADSLTEPQWQPVRRALDAVVRDISGPTPDYSKIGQDLADFAVADGTCTPLTGSSHPVKVTTSAYVAPPPTVSVPPRTIPPYTVPPPPAPPPPPLPRP